MSHPLPAKPVSTPTQAPAPAQAPPPARPAPTPVPTLLPSALTSTAALLVSAVPIPQAAAVVCRCWTGSDEGIESARRHIFDVAAGAPDVSTALAAVVKPDVELTLWAFAVVAADADAPRLSALDFARLGLRETTPALCRFDLSHLHPCSAQCATAVIPCADCTKPRPPTLCPLARIALKTSRPVRQPLRHLYQLWTSALRALVLERLTHPHLLPTPHGILLNPPQTPTGEWGRQWSEQRSLTHAHVHISLSHPLPRPSSPSHILIHLLPHPTHLYALPSNNSPVPGTPLRLLPTFSPAYAVTPYNGPTPFGFLQSLGGRGVPPSASASPCILVWLPLPPASGTNAASPPGLPTPSATTPAAIGGAPSGSRGMYAVWPRTLCVVDSKMSAIDVAKLPSVPPGLTGQSGVGWVKPRRFGGKKAKLSKPIPLAQPSSQPSASTSTQPPALPQSQPQPEPDPSLTSLANTAANLIEAVVRAREKEKEKQRARMERARSGSAVPIPGPGVLGGGTGVTTGPSTPVPDPQQPLLQIQTTQQQTQTPTSGLYPSPLANTPIQYVGSATSAASAVTANAVSAVANTSPSSDDTFGIGMDLFGDQEVGEQDAVFGQTGFGDGATFPEGFPFPFDAAMPAPGEPDPLQDLWNVPEMQQQDQTLKPGDEDGELRDEDFDVFGDWAPSTSANIPLVTEPPAVTMDVDPPNPNPPTPALSSSPASIPQLAVQEKPYFPLTPPSEEHDGEAGRISPFGPLKFTRKFECVDEKYRGWDGKFGVKGRLVAGRTRAVTFIASGTESGTRAITGRTRSLSGAVREIGTPATILAKRMEAGLGLRARTFSGVGYPQITQSASLQLQPQRQLQPAHQPRLYPQLQLSHLPQFQFKNQLPTPQPSPNALRRLRTGYVGMTNPSAKRIRTLRLVHDKPRAETEAGAVSVFARDWVAVETKKPGRDGSRPHSPTATLSSDSSDSESDGSDMELVPGTGPHTAAPSRGTTPPTSAHPNGSSPPGPGLLVAHFRPSMLGSGALGDVLPWVDGKDTKPSAPGPISVPTPVSPGDIHEASKEVIEAGANVLAREAVDNWAWGTDHCQVEPSQALLQTQPSRNELMLLGNCLSSIAPGMLMSIGKFTALPKVEVVNEVLTDRTYPQLARLEKLRQPKISVGHSGQVVQMSAPALRFWETMGLEPVGGMKDVVAYGVFEEGEDGGVVKRWLERVGQVYEARRLGKHALGAVGGGLVPVRWESVTRTLTTFISSLPQTSPHIILYMILPQRAFFTPSLQSLLHNLKSNVFISTLSEDRARLSTHLVPATLLFEHTTGPSNSRQRFEHTVLAVYDRIPRTVGRRIRRQILPPLPVPTETTVHVPAFTLARPLAPRFRFSMEWPDGQREVMDRHMFLHVAYGYSKSRRWLGAACVDERGEAYETRVWRASEDHARDGESKDEIPVAKIVAKVWAFAMKFVKRAAIEWRVVFCRMGVMDVDELEAWETHTTAALSDVRMGMHVSVLSFDHTSGLALSTCPSPSMKAPTALPGLPPSAVIDLTANDYLVLPGLDAEICTVPDLELPATELPPSLLPLATAHFFRLTDPPITRPMGKVHDIPPKPDDPPVTVLSSQLHLLHVALTQNSSLWKSGGDPWRELLQSFYALSVLTQARLPALDPLPVHLAMLSVIVGVADNRVLVPVDLPAESLS